MSIFYKTLLAFGLFSTIGCGSTYYKPTPMTMPNFKEKDELFLAVDVHLSLRGGDVQAAYAVTDHLAVQGNYMKNSATSTTGTLALNPVKTTREIAFGECAIGYFTQKNSLGTFSVFGGYGMGKVSNTIVNGSQATADFSKIFIQSSLGFREEHVEFVGSAKLAALQYAYLNHTFTSTDDINRFNALKNTIPMIEFGGVMRFGGDVKVQLFMTSTTKLGANDLFQYDFFTMGLGVCTQLSTLKKPKRRTR